MLKRSGTSRNHERRRGDGERRSVATESEGGCQKNQRQSRRESRDSGREREEESLRGKGGEGRRESWRGGWGRSGRYPTLASSSVLFGSAERAGNHGGSGKGARGTRPSSAHASPERLVFPVVQPRHPCPPSLVSGPYRPGDRILKEVGTGSGAPCGRQGPETP